MIRLAKKKKCKDCEEEEDDETDIESRIEYTGTGFWLTVTSPKLEDSRTTFKELYVKMRKENRNWKQRYHG